MCVKLNFYSEYATCLMNNNYMLLNPCTGLYMYLCTIIVAFLHDHEHILNIFVYF